MNLPLRPGGHAALDLVADKGACAGARFTQVEAAILIRRCLAIPLLLIAWSSVTLAVDYRTVTVTGAGGVPLQVAEAGDASGPGVLFIHGATLRSSSWLQQLD